MKKLKFKTRNSRNKNINRTLAIATGAFVLISVVLAFQLIPFTVAHDNNDVSSTDDNLDMMGCHDMMAEMSIEDMDKDSDGICDFCGMSIEECEAMMDSEGNGHMDGHMGMIGMMGMKDMNCHMNE